jgi:N-methylhydantoinase B
MGGEKGRPTVAYVHRDGGEPEEHMKVTGLALPKGGLVEILSSGGGGYGDPAERSAEEVQADIAAGYMTEAVARERYPHAFEG